eukprot:Lankesteria_metandrocarpae@DN5229_c0_g1_i1.p1
MSCIDPLYRYASTLRRGAAWTVHRHAAPLVYRHAAPPVCCTPVVDANTDYSTSFNKYRYRSDSAYRSDYRHKYIFGTQTRLHSTSGTQRNTTGNKKYLYDLLGLSRNASKADIKRRYCELAKQHHPDVNHSDDAEEKMSELTSAYKVLIDDSKREQYDAFGDESDAGGGAWRNTTAKNLSSLFEELFSQKTDFTPRQRRGPDIQALLELSLEEAVFGCVRTVDLRDVDRPCSACDHTGSSTKAQPHTCNVCMGSGMMRTGTSNKNGRMQVNWFQLRPCTSCSGTGIEVKDPCRLCSGRGILRSASIEQQTVNIPKGVDSGMELRLQGRGHSGANGSPPGDLNLQVRVKPHSIFHRVGNDLHQMVGITLKQAAVGGTIQIAKLLPKGQYKGQSMRSPLNLPKEATPGATVRADDRDLPQGMRMFVTLKLLVPSEINAEQLSLLDKFQASSNDAETDRVLTREESLMNRGGVNEPHRRSWWSKLRTGWS